VAFAVLDDPNALNGLCELIAAHTGVPFAAQQLTDLGKAVLVKERDFNARAGFTALDDRLPDYFKTEKLAPHNTTFDVPDDDLDKVLDFSR